MNKMLKIDHDEPYDEHYISDILKTVKTIAMVGASNDKTKLVAILPHKRYFKVDGKSRWRE